MGQRSSTALAAASILTWGLFANPALLYFLGWRYTAIATPWTLLFTAAAFALFICVAAAYVPARLSAVTGMEFEQQAESFFGKWPGLLIARVLTPLWALSWFALSAGWASALLLTALHHGAGVPPESAGAHVLADAGILALILPFAAQSPLALALNSRFAVKVAVLAVTALMVSAISGVPRTYLRLTGSGWGTTWLDRDILLWALPAVMFATTILAEQRSDKAAVRRYVLLGVALPLFFATAAGILTLAGAADWGVHLWKIPEYHIVFLRRETKIGWGKGLVMVFALLTVIRFSLHVATKHALGGVSLARCAALGIGAFIVIEAGVNWFTFSRIWSYFALPFVGIAGAFSAALATRSSGPFRLADRAAATIAIAAGAISTEALYQDLLSQSPGFAVIAGWLIAFLVTLAARLLSRTRTRESAPLPAP